MYNPLCYLLKKNENFYYFEDNTIGKFCKDLEKFWLFFTLYSMMIADSVDYDFDTFIDEMTIKGAEYFRHLPGVGDALINSLNAYWENHYSDILQLANEFTFEKSNMVLDEIPKTLQGKTFVVTGSVHHYKNRDELKADIVTHGGTVSGSVSSKTSYLINNDINSTSSKNQKAKSLNIPIITEEEFLQMIK